MKEYPNNVGYLTQITKSTSWGNNKDPIKNLIKKALSEDENLTERLAIISKNEETAGFITDEQVYFFFEYLIKEKQFTEKCWTALTCMKENIQIKKMIMSQKNFEKLIDVFVSHITTFDPDLITKSKELQNQLTEAHLTKIIHAIATNIKEIPEDHLNKIVNNDEVYSKIKKESVKELITSIINIINTSKISRSLFNVIAGNNNIVKIMADENEPEDYIVQLMNAVSDGGNSYPKYKEKILETIREEEILRAAAIKYLKSAPGQDNDNIDIPSLMNKLEKEKEF
jgi:hypothetical protein